MRLTEVLKPEHVVAPLHADTFRGAVTALVQRLVETGAVRRPELLERLSSEERIRDVVHVGDRVLLPHLRTEAVDRLVVAIGVAASPLRVQAGAAPGEERVVVLVLAPPAAANHYLQIVAALARALRTDATVDRLAQAGSPAEVLEIAEIRDLVVQPRLTVRDIMTQRVFRVYPDTPARELLELMSRNDLKAVPVVGEKREVLGMVSDRDLLRHLMPNVLRAGAGERSEPQPGERANLDVPVREIMSRSVMCISEDQALAEVVSTMINKDVERLPVVNEGKLTGFLTRGDVLRKLFGQ
jgi:CBS domain-containing protein